MVEKLLVQPWLGLNFENDEQLNLFCSKLVDVHLDLDCVSCEVENTSLISIEDVKCFLEVLKSLII